MYKVKKQIIVVCDTEEEMRAVGTKIHEQLVGNKDYIDSKVILTLGTDLSENIIPDELNKQVHLTIFDDAIDIPEINI